MASAAQPDYEALARQFGGGRKIDYDALAQQYGGKRKVNTAEEETAAAPKSPKGFVSSVWARHPTKLLAELAASPFETAKSFLTELKRAPAEALGLPGTETDRMTQEAAAAFKRGDYKTGIIKGYASFLNFIPIGAAQALEQAAEQVNRGDVPGALGTAYGFGGPLVAASPTRPKAAAASIKRGVAGGKRMASAAPEVVAVWALRKFGVPAPIAHAAVRRAKEAIQKTAAEMAEAPPTAEQAARSGRLDDIARSQARKPFAKLTPEQQQTVRELAERIKDSESRRTVPPSIAAAPVTPAPAGQVSPPLAGAPAGGEPSIAALAQPLPPSRPLTGPPRVLFTKPPAPQSSITLSHARPQMGVNPITSEPIIFYTGESLVDGTQIRAAFGEAVRT